MMILDDVDGLDDDDTVSLESELTTAIEDLNVTLESLNGHYNRIASQGKISRTEAQLLIKDYEVDFGTAYPIGSFTTIPTATNLNVALESILSTAGKILKETFKAIGDFIEKVIQWIIDAIKKLRHSFEVIEKKRNNVVSLKEESDRLQAKAKTLHVNITETSGKETNESSDDVENRLQDFETSKKTLFDHYTKLTHSIFFINDFMATIGHIAIGIGGVPKLLTSKEQLMGKAMMASSTEATVSMLNTVATPINVNDGISSFVKKIATDEKIDSSDLHDLMRALHETFSKMNMVADTDNHNVSYDQLYAKIATVSENGDVKRVSGIVTNMNLEKQLEDIKKIYKTIADVELAEGADSRIVTTLKKALAQLKREIAGLQLFESSMLIVSSAYNHVIKNMLRCEVDRYECIRSQVSDSKNSELIAEMRRSREELQKKLHE